MTGTAQQHPKTVDKDTVNLHKWAEVTGTAHQHHRTVGTDTAQKRTSPSGGRGYSLQVQISSTEQRLPHIRTAKRDRLSTSPDGKKGCMYSCIQYINSKELGLKLQHIFTCDQRLLEQAELK